MHDMQRIRIADGDSDMPSVGLGFWKVSADQAPGLVKRAIQMGYRHLDCACDYGNEPAVGDGLTSAFQSGLVARNDMWITSKLWNTYHRKENVRPALERTLKDLKLEYLDLYLIHFPISQKFVPMGHRYPPEWFYDPECENPRIELDPVPIHETWEAMESLVEAGLTRHIGISNFGTSLIRDLLSYARIRPAVLQVELHPYLTQDKLLQYCRNESLAVTGFSPLGPESYFSLGMAQPEESLFKHPVIGMISQHHNKTPAQICLRWGIQRGAAVVPKAATEAHLLENIQIHDFTLSDDEMAAISSLNRNRRFNDPGDFAQSAFNTFLPIYE